MLRRDFLSLLVAPAVLNSGIIMPISGVIYRPMSMWIERRFNGERNLLRGIAGLTDNNEVFEWQRTVNPIGKISQRVVNNAQYSADCSYDWLGPISMKHMRNLSGIFVRNASDA